MQGSLLVQGLFKFENPRVVVRSLLSMETDDIMWLSCDVTGSHAIDAFLTSPTVKSIKKKKLVEKMRVSVPRLHFCRSLLCYVLVGLMLLFCLCSHILFSSVRTSMAVV